MFKFLGLNPPPSKKKRTREDISAVNRLYDAERRHRMFQELCSFGPVIFVAGQ